MKDRDLKMRLRYEQKEYCPDKSGMTRVEKIIERKIINRAEKEKAEWLKERNKNENL